MAVINGDLAEISWLNQRIRDLERHNIEIAREHAHKIGELKSSVERLMAHRPQIEESEAHFSKNIGVLKKRVDAAGDSRSDFIDGFVNGLKKHKDLITDLAVVGLGSVAIFLLGAEYGRLMSPSIEFKAQIMGGSAR